MSKSYIILMAFILLVNASCRTTLTPEKPDENYLPWNKTPEPSYIQVPFTLSLKSIEEIVNKHLTGLIYEDDSFDNNGKDNLMLKVWKVGNIRLNMEGNTLFWQIPLKIWAKTGFRLDKLGLNFNEYREFNAEIELKYRTRIELKPDWTLQTNTTSVGYQWLKEPSLKIGLWDIPITRLANIFLNAFQDRLSSSIDASVQKYFSLKLYASQLWKSFEHPMRINEFPEVWISIRPEEFFSQPFTAQEGKIVWKAAVKADIEVTVGPKPAPKPSIPFKPLVTDVPQSPSSWIFAKFNINLEEIARFAEKQLKGQKFSKGKRNVSIEAIKIYGSNGSLVVESEVRGSVNGKVYFSGKPVYDPIK